MNRMSLLRSVKRADVLLSARRRPAFVGLVVSSRNHSNSAPNSMIYSAFPSKSFLSSSQYGEVSRLLSRLSVSVPRRDLHSAASPAPSAPPANPATVEGGAANAASGGSKLGNSDSAAKQSGPLSSKEKLKVLWRKYGWLTVGTYLGIYASTLTGMFLSLEFDLFNAATFGLDTATLVDMFCHTVERFTGATHIAEFVRSNPTYGTFAIAYIMTKFTEPLRLGATVVAVPRISRAIGHRKHEHDDA